MGRFEKQRVTFSGTVRHFAVQKPSTPREVPLLKLAVASGGQNLDVLARFPSALDLTRLIDSTVLVQGYAGSYRNRRGQFLGAVVTADREGDIRVINPGPVDAFAGAQEPLGQILTSADRNHGDHRIRTRGVITHLVAGHEINIQDGDAAIVVQTPANAGVHLGEAVDIVGFESIVNSSPQIVDALVKPAGDRLIQPRALRATMDQIVEGELEARLVQLTGMVFDVVPRPGEFLIVVQNGRSMVGVYLPDLKRDDLRNVKPGAKVEFTGVVSLIYDENHKVKSFSLRLRDSNDIRVLSTAPWWTTQRAFMLLGGAASVIFLVVLWVILLQKRVSAQTQLIRATLESTADGILVLDHGDKYVDANEKFRTIWNLTAPCAGDSQKAVLDRIGPNLLDPNSLHRLLHESESKGQVSTELTLRTGAVVECDYERIQGSRTAGAVLSFRDITSRRKSERLEGDRNRILEAISREDPLDGILLDVCRLAEHQDTSIGCGIQLVDKNGLAMGVIGTHLPEAEFSSASSDGQSAKTGNVLASRRLVSSSNTELGHLSITSGSSVSVSEELQQVITIASQLASIAIEHRRLFDRLDHLAYHDPLTGLRNRGALNSELQIQIETTRNSDLTFAVLCIDLDRFKQINDTLSHHTGDLFICAVARRLKEAVNAQDGTVFRVGGDEFTILLRIGTSLERAEEVAETVLGRLREGFPIADRTLHTTASVGISVFPAHGSTPAALQQAADSAMYKAKHGGKDQYKVFRAEWRVQEDGSFEMEAFLRQAIESEWFEIHYQPKVTTSRRVCGLEALIRLRHPDIGLIPPDRFISIAEDSGLIIPIGAWALNEVCRQITVWRKNGVPPCRVAVNVSAAQFARGEFLKTLEGILDRWNLPGDVLELEITESLLMKNVGEATELMKQLRQLGVTFAIDDFGTGYSSLGYLHALPVSTLKNRPDVCWRT